jgi:hypothetical protein
MAFQANAERNFVPPTYQQLQNPSNGFQLTQIGMSTPHNLAPNTYFGSQFNNWNNLQMQPPGLEPFDSFMRTAPIDFGGHYSTNTYLGPMYNDWSNLSTGTVTHNELGGGWNYLP